MTEEEKEQLAGDIELAMPRDWLTADLRMTVAEWVVDMVTTEPWNLTAKDETD